MWSKFRKTPQHVTFGLSLSRVKREGRRLQMEGRNWCESPRGQALAASGEMHAVSVNEVQTVQLTGEESRQTLVLG